MCDSRLFLLMLPLLLKKGFYSQLLHTSCQILIKFTMQLIMNCMQSTSLVYKLLLVALTSFKKKKRNQKQEAFEPFQSSKPRCLKIDHWFYSLHSLNSAETRRGLCYVEGIHIVKPIMFILHTLFFCIEFV